MGKEALLSPPKTSTQLGKIIRNNYTVLWKSIEDM